MTTKKTTAIFIFTIICSIFLTGCMSFFQQQNSLPPTEKEDVDYDEDIGETPTLPENFTLYKNLVYGLQIGYPVNWEMQEDFLGSIVMFLSPLENDLDIFQENVNIITEDLPDGNITVDEYVDVSLAQIEALVLDFNLLESKSLTLNGNPAYKIVYTGSGDGGEQIEWLQVLTIKDTTAYVITFTAEVGAYSNYESVIDEMINTFELI